MAAATLGPEWKSKIEKSPPTADANPRVHVGPVASKNKVVDNVSNEFFLAVWKDWPKLIAVEMEGAGAAHSIQTAREEGKVVGFVMVRGVSDIPKAGKSSPGAVQTEERDSWKEYACEAAGRFICSLIRGRWPEPPKRIAVESRNISGDSETVLHDAIQRLTGIVQGLATRDDVRQLANLIAENQKVAIPSSAQRSSSGWVPLNIATELRGNAYRLVRTSRMGASSSINGGAVPGRWNTKGIPAVYLALSPKSAESEVLYRTPIHPDLRKNLVIVTVAASLQYVLDTRRIEVQRILGAERESALADATVSRKIAEMAFQAGYEAIIAQSSSGVELLVVFPTAMHIGSYLTV